MYLLKQQAQNLIRVNGIEFTFHHVSIKTKNNLKEYPELGEFTFHHVSIKTNRRTSFYS